MFAKIVFLLTVGLLAVVPPSTHAQSCPPAELLAPCECDEGRLRFYCSGQRDPTIDLKAIFDRVSPLIGEDVIFDDILITILPDTYTELAPNTMSSLKFRQIHFDYNKFTRIHPDAFNATYDVTTKLVMFDNRVSNDANTSSHFFDFINRFTQLEELKVTEWYIRDIPSDPFRSFPNMHTLSLEFWGLERAGSRLLANLPNLDYARIGVSDMDVGGYALDAFQGIGSNVSLRLDYNPMSVMFEEIFRPALDSAARVVVGGEDCIGIGMCFKRRFSCDQNVAWVCEDVARYEPKLSGYYCLTGGDFDVFDWCRLNGGRH